MILNLSKICTIVMSEAEARDNGAGRKEEHLKER
jgi:hypothetical protein